MDNKTGGVTLPKWAVWVLGIVLAVNLFLVLVALAGENGSTFGPYNRVCNQPGVYNNQGGYNQTVYYPCTSDVP